MKKKTFVRYCIFHFISASFSWLKVKLNENSKLLKNEVSSNRKCKLKILTQMRRTKFHNYKIFLLSSHLDLFAKNGLLSFPSFPLIIRFSSTQFYLYPSLFHSV